LVKSVINSKFKSTGLKDLKLKELENGAKVVEDFEFGNKGDVKNFNVEINKVKFKWNTVNKETKETKEYTTEIFLYRNRGDDNTVTFGKTPEIEKAVLKQMEELIKTLENRDTSEVRVGIKFVEDKEGKKRSYIGYIGQAKSPGKEKKIENKEAQKEAPKQENKPKPKPADMDEIPF
jgi:hypothetical protein